MGDSQLDVERKNEIQAPQGVACVARNEGNGTQIGFNYGTVVTPLTPEDREDIARLVVEQLKPNSQGGSQSEETHSVEWSLLSRKYYSLFVLENEVYSKRVFCISKKRALQRYTPIGLLEKFMALTLEDVDELKKMPCIFARRNQNYNGEGEKNKFLVGCITDIVVQEENIQITFSKFGEYSQAILNDHVRDLNIEFAWARNELDEEHWAIKECDLIEAFEHLNLKIA